MVYECPQCKTPLPPGASSCARCGLQFATPIPADATLPAPGSTTTTAPAYEDTTGYDGAGGSDSAPSRRVIAAVAALCAVLVVIAAFAVYTFSHTPAPTPAVITTPGGAPPVSPVSGVPGAGPSPATNYGAGNTAPVTLPSGGAGSGSATQNNGGAMVGHWQSKTGGFYQFNADGTGSRSNGGHTESFTWVLDENTIVIHAHRTESIHFSSGPDANSLYISSASGRYELYTRAG